MPTSTPPSQTGRPEASVMLAIEANEEEALRTGYLTVEAAEADLEEMFKELEADLAAGRIAP